MRHLFKQECYSYLKVTLINSLQQNVLNVEITENSEISKFVWPICKHIEESNVRICMLWKCY